MSDYDIALDIEDVYKRQLYGFAQEKVVPIKYGDMDQWIIRKVHESGVIGGNTNLLYEIGPTQEIDGNNPYKNMGGSPWGPSNVMAKVCCLFYPSLPFIFSLLYVCNCLCTTVTKFNYSSG